ncbi:MAG: di-trans,poly-cis-decaprenylcistransferase [Candidatus Nomurabacteria bacterium]|nr:MAG: di-trans,poly-cis-decaprenylcistransferase [Candidatus Nomurabacteria bacterium]
MTQKVPQHIAIIPDGNRRWAKDNHLPSLEGHRRGADVTEEVCFAAIDQGVKVMTFWGFSSENWTRPKREVQYLLAMFAHLLTDRIDRFHEQGIQLRVSGRMDEFPNKLQKLLQAAIEKTAQNKRGIVQLCLNYGGRNEIVDAVKKIVKEKIPAEKIDQKTIAQYLYQPDLPSPDLILRTSGEQRSSGYLLWQAEYAEFFFLKKHWPAVTRRDIIRVIQDFQKRQRRFGS